jgi:hypothetical protein
VLPFKLEQTNDLITARAGLALLGEFTIGVGLLEALDKSLPAPGSGAGYRASEHALPLQREPEQGVEDRLWHAADALRAV